MNINWNYYKHFCYVYKLKSVSSAAKALYTAQSAVSYNIISLENSLGCRLFERTTFGMIPTATGTMLYEKIGAAVAAIEDAEKLLDTTATRHHNTISIGHTDLALQFFLYPHIQSCRKLYPELEIEHYYCKDLQEIMALFEDGKIDYAVLHEAPLYDKRYISTPVKKIRDVVFCSSDHISQLESLPLNPEALSGYPFVTHPKSFIARRNLDEYISAHGAEELSPAREFTLNSSIIYQVSHGFFLGLIYDELIMDDVKLGKFNILPLAPPLPHRYFWLIQPAGKQRPQVSMMTSYILRHLDEI